MYKREDFNIRNTYCFVIGTSKYLFKPGIVMKWSDALLVFDMKSRNKTVYFSSREDVEKCLDKFLRGQEMNYDERIIQCDKDIAVLNVERNKLLKEKEKKNSRFVVGSLEVVKTSPYTFMIGLDRPYANSDSKGYMVRRGFNKYGIEQIIKNLQKMIGE